MAAPWEKYAAQAAPQPVAGTGGLQIEALPEKPKTPPAQTPAQAEKDALEVEKLRRDLAKTPDTDPALAQAVKGLGLDELLTNIDRARSNIKTGFATGVLGSIAGHFPGTPRKDFLGSLEGIKGASILEKLQQLREQSRNGASGMGSLTEQEGERLANSIASLSPDMSADELNKSLDIMERHARALKAVGAGKNPNDPEVQKEFGILPLPGEKGEDKGITESAPLPTIVGEPQLQAATGSEKAVLNPKVAAIAPQLTDYLNADPKKVTNAMILGFVAKSGIDPKGWPSLQDALTKRGKATFAVDPHFTQPMSAVEQLGNEAAQSAPAAAVLNAGNAATAGTAGMLLGDREGMDRALALSNAQHPTASLVGSLAGGTAGAMVPEMALGKLGMAPGLLRGAVADSTYGAASGFGGDPEKENLLGRIANGALLGFGGSLAGQGLLKVPGAFTRGVTSPTVSYVAREIPDSLTLGQALSQSGTGGRFVKGLEDRLSGFSGVGDVINSRRAEGLQKMNAHAFDKALEPIGAKADGLFGEEAVQHAQQEVSNAFQKALSGKVAAVDGGFIHEATQAKAAIAKLPDRVRDEVDGSVDSVINNYFDANGNLTGENLQPLLRELQDIKGAYYSANDPLKKRIGDAVDQVTDSVENLFRRQAPDVMPQYNAAKKAFKRVSTLEDAVLRAKNQSDGKNAIFTPAQLGAADKAATIKFGGKHAAAAGNGEFHDLQRATQSVLPSKVGDSGTAGRAALLIAPAAISGSGAGVGYAAGGDPQSGAAVGLGLSGLLALAYTRAGQRAIVGSITGRGKGAQAVGKALSKAGRISGAVGGSQAALGSQP